MPRLTFTIRDFSLGIKGQTKNEYLEREINKNPSIKHTYNNYFRDRSCFIFPKPTADD